VVHAPAAADGKREHQSEIEQMLNEAWDHYYNVFRRINKQLPELTMLELQYVSPQLLSARALELAVPGTYRVDHSAVRIMNVDPTVEIIKSKQRPR
jgi:FKBP12-rapamycin complex-associated protein